MTKSEAARTLGVSSSSLKPYAKLAQEGRYLTPKKRPDYSKPKINERARRLLEAELEERSALTPCASGRELLRRMASHASPMLPLYYSGS